MPERHYASTERAIVWYAVSLVLTLCKHFWSAAHTSKL